MARHICRWDGERHTRAWANARGLLVTPSAEEDAEDARTWNAAAGEDGALLHVMWCELCQLIDDVKPGHEHPEARHVFETTENPETP